ncbi:MAG: sigma 54-interacting transcriptional regulator [Bacteriovoracales bacterium]|nr:sigma 54-interacting transcriptional regulator [Bacteriovoracales bacterium]
MSTLPLKKKEIKIKSFETILLSSLEEEVFFGNLGRIVKDNFSCDRVIIFKILNDQIPVFISDSENSNVSSYVLEQGTGVCGNVMRTSQPYYSNNVARDPVFSGVKESKGYSAELCVPIIVAGHTLATVHLQRKSDGRHFDAKYIDDFMGFLKFLERPLCNMQIYLTAKHLNEILRQEIQRKDQKLERSKCVESYLYHIKDFDLIGKSSQMRKIRNIVDKLSKPDSDASILIEGESGVGKEAIAKKIHVGSLGEDRPFVKVKASLLTEENFEKEMFGNVEEAFFRAAEEKTGFCELAHQGTLFIEHIGELSSNAQIKLLRFLETKKVFKIGLQKETEVDVRVIASHCGDLQKEVDAGRFRQDLYFMIKGFGFNIPSLREREDDLESLAVFFLNKDKSTIDHKGLSCEALSTLKSYLWPGNAREIKNAMEVAYLVSEGKVVEARHLPANIISCKKKSGGEDGFKDFDGMSLDSLEKRHILRTLDLMKGNKTKVAKTLGITVKTLYNKLHNYKAMEEKEQGISSRKKEKAQ